MRTWSCYAHTGDGRKTHKGDRLTFRCIFATFRHGFFSLVDGGDISMLNRFKLHRRREEINCMKFTGKMKYVKKYLCRLASLRMRDGRFCVGSCCFASFQETLIFAILRSSLLLTTQITFVLLD